MNKKLLVLCLCMGILGCSLSTEQVTKFELRQLMLNSGEKLMGGDFFLGCGSIGIKEMTYYYFYIKDTTGAIYLKKVLSGHVTFYEDLYENDVPYAVTKVITEPNGRRHLGGRWDLHIPKNSIFHSIEPNL